MIRKPLLLESLVLSIVVLVLHKIALTLFLYWTTEWFDILMHLIGGLLIGVLISFLFYTSGLFDFPKDHRGSIFVVIFGSVLVIGLGWELWELFMGFSDVLEDQLDTVLDLVMDGIGAYVAFLYSKRKILKKYDQ